MKTITHWINGKSWEGEPDRTGPVFNPATGHQAAEVAFATAHEVDQAAGAARKAFDDWRVCLAHPPPEHHVLLP